MIRSSNKLTCLKALRNIKTTNLNRTRIINDFRRCSQSGTFQRLSQTLTTSEENSKIIRDDYSIISNVSSRFERSNTIKENISSDRGKFQSSNEPSIQIKTFTNLKSQIDNYWKDSLSYSSLERYRSQSQKKFESNKNFISSIFLNFKIIQSSSSPLSPSVATTEVSKIGKNRYGRDYRKLLSFNSLILCESIALDLDSEDQIGIQEDEVITDENLFDGDDDLRKDHDRNHIKGESIVSFSQLSFGSVMGLFVGIFFRKGLGLIGFFVGGGFFILQYLNSKGLIKVNWKNFEKRYERLTSIERPNEEGEEEEEKEEKEFGIKKNKINNNNNNNLKKLMKSLMEFLTDDFQYRSTFILGFFLGFKIG